MYVRVIEALNVIYKFTERETDFNNIHCYPKLKYILPKRTSTLLAPKFETTFQNRNVKFLKSKRRYKWDIELQLFL